MATVPGSLMWEIVKRNNCFLLEEFRNGNVSVQFCKERNNLYNVVDNKYRQDLKNVVLARLSAVRQSLKVAKSGPKKRNRQDAKLMSFKMSQKK